jgi:hypothetical protein
MSTAQVLITLLTFKNCIHGIFNETVYVTVGNEQTSFLLNCKSPWRERFETETSGQCELETGMCTGFYPSKSIKVRCEDGSSGSTAVACPTEGPPGPKP